MSLLDLVKKDQFDGDQTKEERNQADKIRSEIEQIRSTANRIAHEGIWMTNIAYLMGYDGLNYNTSTRQFQPINRASAYLRKNRLHVNKILPTIQNRQARICKSVPKYDVFPESNSGEDREAARLGEHIIESMWQKLSLDEKRLELSMWTQQCGHAYVKVCWDPTLGKKITDPITGEQDYEGDVRVDVVSAFELFPDPLAKTLKDCRHLIQAKVRPLEYFKSRYEKGALVKEEQAWLLSLQYESRINSINARGPSQGGLQEQMKNSAIEMIKYTRPSYDYPNGRMEVAANGIILEDKELPVGEISFAKFDDIMVAGKYYSESVITHLRPIQDQYNEVVRRRAEWTRRLLAGKYRAARGSGLAQESLNDESGEIVYYNPVPNAPNGGAPEPMQVPNIPAFAYEEEKTLDDQINYIAGISDVSRGSLPSASIPAIGMQLLTEQDDTRIGVMIENHENSWSQVFSLILKFVEKYYITPRKIKIAGPELEYCVKEVTGEDLRGNTDVRVIRGSTLPGSKTLKRQEILNTYSQGLLGNPQDPKVKQMVLGMIEFGNSQGIWEDYGLDQAQIKRGLAQIENGVTIEVNELDNHVEWILEMNRYRKSDKFDSLSPEVKSIFSQVLEEHVQASLKLLNMIPTPPPPMAPPPGATPQGAP